MRKELQINNEEYDSILNQAVEHIRSTRINCSQTTEQCHTINLLEFRKIDC